MPIRIHLYFILIFFSAFTQAQHPLSSPKTVNYTNADYKAGLQNWDIAQDSQGLLYFGNNEGLLTFNGKSWNLYPLPNKTLVRSLAIGTDNRIYVGAQDEIGYFSPTPNGMLAYHSLNELVPKQETGFGDIWNLVTQHDGVYFRENNKIFLYHKNAIKIFKPQNRWTFLGKVDNRIIAQDQGTALLEFKNGVWETLNTDPELMRYTITGLLPGKDHSLIITTLENGLYVLHRGTLSKFGTEVDQILKQAQLYSATYKDGSFILGTQAAGVLMTDSLGRFQQSFTHTDGLQTENIRKLFIDQHKNLWLGLDDGIDYIAINSAITYIYPDVEKQLTGYAVHRLGEKLYFGTSNGVYTIGTNENARKGMDGHPYLPIQNSYGQVWNLQEINGQLLMGHERGAFTIDGDLATPIFQNTGSWIFSPAFPIFPAQHIIAGTYTGLHAIRYQQGNWIDKGHIDSLYESLRFLVMDQKSNTIWTSHPGRGIYKIEMNDARTSVRNVKLYKADDGLPSDLFNYVFNVDNQLVAATENGLFIYDETEDRFIPENRQYKLLQEKNIQYLYQDNQTNLWFVSNKEVGVLMANPTQKDRQKVVYFPEIKNRVLGGHEAIYSSDEHHIFLAAKKGFIHIDLKAYMEQDRKPLVQINSLKTLKNDSIHYGGHYLISGTREGIPHQPAIPQLSYQMNALQFTFSTDLYDQQDIMEFSYQLQGFEQAWSEWSTKSEKDYTNLPPGTYRFHVRARSNMGQVSDSASYSFVVLAPWYANTWSKTAYALVVLGSLFWLFKWQKKKYQRVHERQRYLHRLELENSEQEIVRLQKEKLEDQVAFKNKELATMAMHLLQRGEVLQNIKETLIDFSKTNQQDTGSLRKIKRIIKEIGKADEDWDHFSLHFNQVNEGLFSILKTHYPQLTPNELKLCAYIRLNLSSKEIAQLMHITSKAVEVSRYRLRKKLSLDSSVNLYEFLLKLSIH